MPILPESLAVLLARARRHGLLCAGLLDLYSEPVPLLHCLLIQVTLGVRVPPTRAGALVRPVSIIERLEVEASLRLIQTWQVAKGREILLLV